MSGMNNFQVLDDPVSEEVNESNMLITEIDPTELVLGPNGSILDRIKVDSQPDNPVESTPSQVILVKHPGQQNVVFLQGVVLAGAGVCPETVVVESAADGPSLVGAVEHSELPLEAAVAVAEAYLAPRACQWAGCDAAFPGLEELVYHVTDRHVRMEAHEVYRCHWQHCQRNGKEFNARYKMIAHIRTHTNEKPHICDICGKQFSRVENLKIHKRTHTGEKPYTCPYKSCNKAYSNSSDRFKHVQTHKTERPYVCKVPGCKKSYTDPSSLRKHSKSSGHRAREAVASVSVNDMTVVTSSECSMEQVITPTVAEVAEITCSNPLLSSSASEDSPTTTEPESRAKSDFTVDGSHLMHLPLTYM